ncbi:uncharacterized protein LTR77_000576 [Saxophila tyrrhenica]|uniref:Actin-like ATPase domain-containing protein n=1 Tax=Saxophila tyrrhenica TaxID=1690608 RepID=A0AAV9PRK8_9PEZI|nr:hypothetical protein LTR77_000576 [Saxophila tyrrhenica]
MASSTADYFSNRPAIRTRPPTSALAGANAGPPHSPRTPLLNRSISSQFGSPGGSYRVEQEENLIYELGSQHLSAGFAGESRPRCIYHFTPDSGRSVGDYRACGPECRRKRRKLQSEDDWGSEHELYRSDLRAVDLGLVEDKLERAVRTVHIDYLQLDTKPRKAVLALPSLLPTPLVEIALKVLFNHHAQPPSVVLLTTPLLACVGAGLRNGLVVELGWEETVVTAVGEYKEVAQRRSVRAGKMLTREMAKLLQEEVKTQLQQGGNADESDVTFEYAEEVTRRMAWCRAGNNSDHTSGLIKLHSPSPDDLRHIYTPFTRLSKPVEDTLLPTASTSPTDFDDHDLSITHLVYRVLLSLPLDLRALCTSRIIITGGLSAIPGLKPRLLQDLSSLIEQRGWDHVHSYGSATAHHAKILQERSANITAIANRQTPEVQFSSSKMPMQESVPHVERIHDDVQDPVTRKVEGEMRKGKAEVVKTEVRGVETLGAWAGASLVAVLRVKGVHEAEREEFWKHGLRGGGGML